uniref:Uncharacterized protein n=1 Tax=Anguilla anguilla TaxID=7936 RepID=A0A0E9U0K7_ANGAN
MDVLELKRTGAVPL